MYGILYIIICVIPSANDMRKKALLLKFPKDKLHRRNRQGDMEYLTEVRF